MEYDADAAASTASAIAKAPISRTSCQFLTSVKGEHGHAESLFRVEAKKGITQRVEKQLEQSLTRMEAR